MAKVLMALLVFQVVVNVLAVPGMVQVSGVPVGTATAAGGGAALLAAVAAGLMRRPIGYPLGWAAQVVSILLGLLTPAMWFMGGLFAFLWIVTFVLGKRLDAAPAA